MKISNWKFVQCAHPVNKSLFLLIAALSFPVLVEANETEEKTSDESAIATESEECRKLKADPKGDVGVILRAGCQPTLEQMSALMDNPVGNVAMWWNQVDYLRLENDANSEEDYKLNYMGIVQWPQALTENWNIINRVVYNIAQVPLDDDKIDDFGSYQGTITPPSSPGQTPLDLFAGDTTGLGDTYYIGFFSPKKATPMGEGKLVWGVGFDVGAPTASEDILGLGKWTAGPAALGIYLGPKWKVGGLYQHYFDFAGSDNRSDVNLSNLQYIYYYGISPTANIGAAPNIIVNWEQSGSDRFTVPIGIGYNSTFNIGTVPVRFGVEAFYSVIKPDNIPSTEWNLRFFLIPAAPAALFEFMQKPLFGD